MRHYCCTDTQHMRKRNHVSKKNTWRSPGAFPVKYKGKQLSQLLDVNLIWQHSGF